MSVNNAAVAARIAAILANIDGMGAVNIGAPTAVPVTVSSYVTLGSQTTQRVAQGVFEQVARFWVMFLYRVDGNETTAENALMGMVDGFVAAVMADLSLAGTVDTATVDSSAADAPDYQLRAGKEYREYPVVVTVTQRGAFAPNPSG